MIVYCTYQNQCSSVAAFLDANSVPASAYHAGKPWQVLICYPPALQLLINAAKEKKALSYFPQN